MLEDGEVDVVSVGEGEEGVPGWDMGTSEIWWGDRRWKGTAGRDRQNSPGQTAQGQAAQEGAERLGNSWSGKMWRHGEG